MNAAPIPYTESQINAIESTAQQTLVVAGPGSGKTSVIVERVLYLLQHEVQPECIVLLTFTNAGAKEMQTRIAARLEAAGMARVRLGYVGTLHSYCLRILEKYGETLGYRSGLGVLEDERADELLKAAAAKLALKTPLIELKALRDELGTNCFDRRPQTPKTLALCEYYKQLRQGNMIDFAGLLTDGTRAWRMNLVPPLSHLLVDEYQDSTQADQDFYFAVQAGAFFFVGDPDQGIFAFRGGSVAALLGLSRMDTWRKVWLQENHRCDAAICDAAQRLIEHNATRAPKVTVSATGGIGSIELLPPARTDAEEAATILQRVNYLLTSGQAKPEDIAILARTNATVKLIGAHAQGAYANIPLARPVEEDALPTGWPLARATVDVLISPLNDFFFNHWLALRDGPEKAQAVARNAAIEAMPMAVVYNAGLPVERLGGQISAWQAIDLLDAHGVSSAAIRRVEAFLAELPGDATLSDLALSMRAQRKSVGKENSCGLNIRTIHSAKGLEWPVVFVAAMEQELMPGGSDHDLQEERRLVYVAATRAKHRLMLSYALSRAGGWEKKREQRPARPSQFIAELGVAVP